jgi:hypothetical protein
VGIPLPGALGGDVQDVDDAPGHWSKKRQGGLGQEKRRHEVQPKHAIERRLTDVLERNALENARAVHQQIETPERLGCPFGKGRRCGGIKEVGLQGYCLSSPGACTLHRGARTVTVGVKMVGHGHAAIHQMVGDGLTEPQPGASHERPTSPNLLHDLSIPRPAGLAGCPSLLLCGVIRPFETDEETHLTKNNLRRALMAAGLALGFAACSNATVPDGGTTTTGGSTTASSTSSTTSSSSSTTSGSSTTASSTTGTTTSGSTAGSTTTSSTGGQTTTGTTTSGNGNNTGATVQLRLANFAPSMGAQVDLCYMNNDDPGAGWQGPLFALGSGDSNGVPYPGVTAYSLPNGPVDISLVKVIPAPIVNVATACIDGGSIGNVNFVGPGGASDIVIGANRSGTLAISGNGQGSFAAISVFAYIDEISTTSSTDSVFRFINSSPAAGTYDFGTDTTNLLVTGAAYGSFGSATGADTEGYQHFTPDGGNYSFLVSQLSSAIQPIDQVNMMPGNGYSFFFGTLPNGGNPWAFFCNDSLADISNFGYCYLPDGGPLYFTDAGY